MAKDLTKKQHRDIEAILLRQLVSENDNAEYWEDQAQLKFMAHDQQGAEHARAEFARRKYAIERIAYIKLCIEKVLNGDYEPKPKEDNG